MSGEADVAWEEVADSWRLDELMEGRMQPTTSDDVLMLMTIGALRPRQPLNEAVRRRTFDAMLAAAEDGAETAEDHTARDPARIEQTLQATLQAFEKARQQRPE
ncbi:hypothetical protein ACF1AY_35390 [Streptomyces sp. NPDC014776]|uniref:hypothetical protein n=1 Tax=unclassified Streptomyces TaxID=2593676 RepID=UPI0036FAF8AB